MKIDNEAYEAQLEDLQTFFPGKRVLTAQEVARYTGLNVKTCVRRYNLKANVGITVVLLARALCYNCPCA